jgi:hypothetical protein
MNMELDKAVDETAARLGMDPEVVAEVVAKMIDPPRDPPAMHSKKSEV